MAYGESNSPSHHGDITGLTTSPLTVTSHPSSMPTYSLYHNPFHKTTPTESLKRSAIVSEIELPLEDDISAIPRTLSVSSELDKLAPTPGPIETTIRNFDNNNNNIISPDYHLAPVQDNDDRGQDQDQRQEQPTLLTSFNEQTTSLLHAYSQSQAQAQAQAQSEDGDTDGMLEQALVLGHISLVLACSLYPGASSMSQTLVEAQTTRESHTLGAQARVVAALTNMGMALVRQFDRTEDRRNLEEAGGLYAMAVTLDVGKELKRIGKEERVGNGQRERRKVSGWDRQEGRRDGEGGNKHGDGNAGQHEDGRSEVLVRLEKLGELLGERGFGK